MIFCVYVSWQFFDCNNVVRFSQGHVLDALAVTEEWYRECNETLSLVIAYGERGERWESSHAVAACRDRAPPKSRHQSHGTGDSGGPTDLLMKYTKNIAKGSVGAMDKDGRVALYRPNFIFTVYPIL
jgi:hypothetical protein